MRKRVGILVWFSLVWAWLLPATAFAQSRHFGDISVSAHRLANGNTHHGYVEYRFTIANANPSRDYDVRVSLPSQSHRRGGEVIDGLRRSVKVTAGGTVSLPILQPALPIHGRNSARIHVDGREAGTVHLSGGFNHAEHIHGGIPPRPYLVSRALDSSALDTALATLAGGGTVAKADYDPSQATGKPDVPKGRGGYQANAWMPERSGRFEWLDLKYSVHVKPIRIRIHKTGRDDSIKRIEFYGKSGTIVGTVTNTGSSSRHDSRYVPYDLKVAGVTQAVHRVRMEMDGSRGGYMGIDAVSLSGDGKTVFATAATASSTYATLHRRSSGTVLDKATVLRSELEVTDWSDNWLAYSGYDAIVLHGSDLRAMPPPVSRAFWQYLEAGGVAVVLGTASFPKHVDVELESESGGTQRFVVGFGKCLVMEVGDTRALESKHLRAMEEAAKRTSAVWPAFGDVSTANSAFPVVDNLTIPVRGIALIMLIFIIVVGPLNIFVLAKLNRRIWMLWTIPTISLATCAVVFIYSLFSEGITPTVRVEAVTLLDHASRRATTLGRLAYYCPLTPSGGVRFDYDTELYPLVSRNWGAGTGKSVNWTDGQHLDSGWVQARMPAHFAVRRSETRRERLRFEKDEAGNWVVVNGLGVSVKQLVYRTDPAHEGDGRSQVWKSGPVAPGARVMLIRSNETGDKERKIGVLRRLFRDGRWSVESVKPLVSGGNQPGGSYVAELAGSPFLDDGLEGRKHLKAASIVIGRLSPEEVSL